MVKFTKIGYNRKVVMEYERDVHGDHPTSKHPSEHEPLPSFKRALEAFGPYVLKVMQFPDSFLDRVTPISVHISRMDNDTRRGVKVTFGLDTETGPTSVNTPLHREPLDHQEKGTRYLENEDVDLLDELVKEAQKFYDGEREQGTLDVDG